MTPNRFLLVAMMAAFLLVTLSACSTHRASASRVDNFADWILSREEMQEEPTSQLTIILAGDSATRVIEAEGSTTDLFPIGSVTKILTALLVLQAAEERLIDLDDPVAGLGHLSGEDVTWRQLLEHRAGFVDKRMDPTLPEAAMPVVPPGTLFIYSNEGYAALARALETIEGRPYSQIADDRVFSVLGMQDVSWMGTPGNGSWTPPIGSSGLQASAHDLSLFASALAQRDQRLLSRRGWDNLFEMDVWEEVAASPSSGPTRIALVQEGRVTGTRSALIVFPKARGAMLTLFPEDESAAEDPSEELAQRIQGESIRRWGERPAAFRLSHLNPVRWFRSSACTICDWKAREGVYVSALSGEQLVIVDESGGPILIDDDGTTLAIGPELREGRTRFHDLYVAVTDAPTDSMIHSWPHRMGRPDVVEFVEQSGQALGLLRGAEWFEKVQE